MSHRSDIDNIPSSGRSLVLSPRSPRGVADHDFHMSLPGAFGFRGEHALINYDRAARGLPALKRNRFLDRLCQLHARHMAVEQRVQHSAHTCSQVQDALNAEHVGENVLRGDSIEDMHEQAMKQPESYRNIVAKSFQEFGLATCAGKDGKLYMVVLFRGEERKLEQEQICI